MTVWRRLVKGIVFLLIAMVFLSDSHAQFITNGSASLISGNCYELTPDIGGQAGTVFSQNTIDLTQPFMISTVMFFGCKDAQGADGIVFIFATSNTAVGVGGGELGYGGISPSIAIEYDDYQNGWGDPAQDHMAIISNGSLDHNAGTNLVGPTVITEVEDCIDHCFSAMWDPVSMTLTGNLDGEIISYTGDIVNTIFGGNPNVYFGYSSGTGSLSNQHIVCIGPPVLDPMDDITICEGESANLQADQNGIAWQWIANPTLSATDISNPVATPIQTTTYHVTIQYPCGGSAMDDVLVTVIPMPVVEVSNNGPLCVGDTLQLMADGGSSYQWTGPGGQGWSIQYPSIPDVTELEDGTYYVTVTDANGCSTEGSTEVTVYPETNVEIDPPQYILCENGESIQLTATPPGGIWTGSIESNGIFDPVTYGAGMHDVLYSVTDANGCTGSDVITLEVVPNTPALIIPDGPFCVSDPVQTLSATPAGGTWGDAADPNGMLDPGTLGPGEHLITYQYSDQNGCFDAELFVEVFDVPEVIIDQAGPFCPGDSSAVLGAIPSGGVWSGDVGVDGLFDPGAQGPGLYEAVYSYLDPNGCQANDTINIEVLPDPPQVSNILLECDSLGTGYVLTFEINGGDPSTYQVTGTPGGQLLSGTPAVFVSDTIVPGGSYNFVIDDSDHCSPTTLTGSFACSCATNAGDMGQNLIMACTNGSAIDVGAAIGSVLDPDDSLVYILHHGNSNFLDNILSGSSDGVFAFGPPLQAGVTYYVSAVAGNSGTPYGVNLSDPCLSVSVGTPVMWVDYPKGQLNGPAEICEGSTATITCTFTGIGPYSIVFWDGSSQIEVDSVLDGYSYDIDLTTTTIFLLTEIYDLGGPQCKGEDTSSLEVVVNPEYLVQEEITICEGDSAVIGGEVQTAGGLYLQTLSSQSGCDSMIESTLYVLPVDTVYVEDTSCDSTMTGEFITTLTNQYNCDSVVITNVEYVLADTTELFATTCDQSEAGITTTTLQSGLGCDSVVIETVTLVPSDSTLLYNETCDAMQAGVFIETFLNQGGCDSTVVLEVVLQPSWEIETFEETCDPSLAGVYVMELLTAGGCDSILIRNVDLNPSDTISETVMTCEPVDTGMQVNYYSNQFGCDSVVIVNTVLDESSICDTDHDIYVPNVFSPNGDRINDIFTIHADPAFYVRILYLRVYDRWGALVAEIRDFIPGHPDSGWNGTRNGEILDPGVFVWVSELEQMDGRTVLLSGDITLIK